MVQIYEAVETIKEALLTKEINAEDIYLILDAIAENEPDIFEAFFDKEDLEGKDVTNFEPEDGS